MKKISKLFALLLVLAMMASLVACDSGKETIIGKWNCEMNIGEAIGAYMEESAGTSGLAPDTELRMNLILEFKDDGKSEMTVKVNEDDFKKYIEELCDKMIDHRNMGDIVKHHCFFAVVCIQIVGYHMLAKYKAVAETLYGYISENVVVVLVAGGNKTCRVTGIVLKHFTLYRIANGVI